MRGLSPQPGFIFRTDGSETLASIFWFGGAGLSVPEPIFERPANWLKTTRSFYQQRTSNSKTVEPLFVANGKAGWPEEKEKRNSEIGKLLSTKKDMSSEPVNSFFHSPIMIL